MSSPAATLFHPFATGVLDLPPARARILVLGARPDLRLPEGFGGDLHMVQGFRPDFLGLQRGGFSVTPEPEGEGYDMALVLAGRHRGQNEAWLADAATRVGPGGMAVVAGGKKEGGDSLRKWAAAAVALDGHLSKHHGVVFWFERPDGEALSRLAGGAGRGERVEGVFETAPGMFSHDRVDPASRLLATHLPERIGGRVADFGAGWGYLAAEMLKRGDGISALDLYEADHASLQAAGRNLTGIAGAVPIGLFWRDLLQEAVPRQYDLVVMNPPFHQGRAADPAIGQGMIRAASAALKPGGRLLMVANRPLPYEKALEAGFASHGEIVRDERFKVLWARR